MIILVIVFENRIETLIVMDLVDVVDIVVCAAYLQRSKLLLFNKGMVD